MFDYYNSTTGFVLLIAIANINTVGEIGLYYIYANSIISPDKLSYRIYILFAYWFLAQVAI